MGRLRSWSDRQPHRLLAQQAQHQHQAVEVEQQAGEHRSAPGQGWDDPGAGRLLGDAAVDFDCAEARSCGLEVTTK